MTAIMALADLLTSFPPASYPPPWSWDDETGAILARLCLCCGKPGHYQLMLEAHLRVNGLNEGVYLCDGRVVDGHHRIVAARRLGIDLIPLESEDDAKARWLCDHGPVSWVERRVGDVRAQDWDWVHQCRAGAEAR